MTNRLRTVLQAFLSSPMAFGADLGTLSDERRRMLLDELRRLQSSNAQYLAFWTALLAIAFFAALAVGFATAFGVASMSASAALGATAFGCLLKLSGVLQTKTATEQLLVLAVSFEGPALLRIVDVLGKQAGVGIEATTPATGTV